VGFNYTNETVVVGILARVGVIATPPGVKIAEKEYQENIFVVYPSA
jgi:hypothetical protein